VPSINFTKIHSFKMPARDKYHNQIKEALEKENWEITHDPYVIETEDLNYSIDLGAEKIIGAQKGNQKIAIEIKSFLRESAVSEFHTALGQFLNYKLGLQEVDNERILFLAMPQSAYQKLRKKPLIMRSIETYEVKLIVFDVDEKRILQWKK